MAFAQLGTAVEGVESVDTLTHDVPLPGGTGGILLVMSAINGNPVISNLPWGITAPLLSEGNSAVPSTTRVLVLAKFADGSETASSFTTDLAEQSVTRVYRLTDAHGTSMPEVTFFKPGASADHDPPPITPTWGKEDTTFIIMSGHINGATTITTWPTNYINQQLYTASGSATPSVGLASASREFSIATEDPPSLILSAGRNGVVATIAIRTGNAADTTNPIVTINTVHGPGPVADIYRSVGYDRQTDTLTIHGSAIDNIGVTSVTVSVDGGVAQVAEGTDYWRLLIDVSNWAPGEHTIVVTAADAVGRTGTRTMTVWHNPSGFYGAAPVAGQHLIPISARG